MAIIKCKMCGGDLNIAENNSVAVCEYCGTQQTVPSADNEKKLTLFGRANRLRMACEFDKAAGVYESIVADFPEEAEAYWGLVLCKYGIEYVDDPATGKKIPTCHRSSFDSVMDDSNLEQALENADAIARRVYRDEAKAIEDLRKGIIEVSGKEDPYDIFICYKETDDNGDRTIDSVIAQEVYDALTEKGYRVFFSRITLEDKLGQEYEPYIFAALHSAKIMLAFGTDYEYYNAVWVKNEWSRFLQLIAAGEKKTLIPCYKNIDAYDMPKEFARLQAQDMGKVGAMQDLLRGIEKILGAKEQKKAANNDAAAAQTAQGNLTAPLIKRAFSLLEEGDWKAADACCERLLDFDSECAEAYLGKLMAKLHIKQPADLQNSAVAFEDNPYYVKAIQFAEEKDNNILLAELKASAEAFRNKREEEEAIAREKAKAAAKRAKKIVPIVAAVAVIIIAAVSVVTKVVIPNGKYNDAVKLMEEGKYEEAIAAFDAMDGFKASADLIIKSENAILETKYMSALSLMEKGQYEQAIVAFETLGEYKDSTEKIDQCNIGIYGEKVWNKLKNANIGNTITFGSYEQDNNFSNGKEEIEWIVIAKDGTKILVTSKYALDCKRYNNSKTSVNWETCSLRTWLNSDFVNSAFSADEKAMIPMEMVFTDKFGKDQRRATNDQVFLLSTTQVNEYCRPANADKCSPTDYAVSNGALFDSSNGNCWWWLRTPGDPSSTTRHVMPSGQVYLDNTDVDGDVYGVRPAMWIDLNA